jgi:hypothetical protein
LYLSRSCERLLGFKRISAAPIAPRELLADYLFVTHYHGDHLDVDTVPALAQKMGCRIIASPCAALKCQEIGIDNDQILELPAGDSFTGEDFTVHAMPCDHNPKAPLAVGFLFDFGKIRIYFSGDTCYRRISYRKRPPSNHRFRYCPSTGIRKPERPRRRQSGFESGLAGGDPLPFLDLYGAQRTRGGSGRFQKGDGGA